MSSNNPVLAAWDLYVFPEASLPAGKPRLTVRDPLPRASVGDLPSLESVDPGGRRTADALIELLSDATRGQSDSAYHGAETELPRVRWLAVSPFNVYLERVFADKLSEIE